MNTEESMQTIAAGKFKAKCLVTMDNAQSKRRCTVGPRFVDDAGMISARQMKGMLRLAEQQRARILFSGDTRQIQSVEVSDAPRVMERESQVKSVSLTGVQRQTHKEYRDAIQTLRQSPEQGFEKLERLGAVHEFHSPNAPTQSPISTAK